MGGEKSLPASLYEREGLGGQGGGHGGVQERGNAGMFVEGRLT